MLGLTKEREREYKQLKGRREAAREGPPKKGEAVNFTCSQETLMPWASGLTLQVPSVGLSIQQRPKHCKPQTRQSPQSSSRAFDVWKVPPESVGPGFLFHLMLSSFNPETTPVPLQRPLLTHIHTHPSPHSKESPMPAFHGYLQYPSLVLLRNT